jgi:hypothetical protein
VLRNVRQWGQALIYLELLYTATWYLVLLIVLGIGIPLAIWRRDLEHLPEMLLLFGVIAGMFLFGCWVRRDARRSTRELRRQRRAAREAGEEPAPAEVGDVAGLPPNPPWMG